MTAVLDAMPESAPDDSVAEQPTASWLARAGAFSVDVVLGVAVIATMALLTLSAPQRDWLWWMFTSTAAVVFLLMAPLPVQKSSLRMADEHLLQELFMQGPY